MSDVLLKRFRARYPPVGPHNTERLSTYPPDGGDTWIERIHLELLEKIFVDLRKPLIVPEDIEKLAEKIFDDIDFKFYYNIDEGHMIFFVPFGIDKYTKFCAISSLSICII